MKKFLLVVLTFAAVSSVRAEEASADHSAPQAAKASTAPVAQPAPTQDKMAKLSQYIQACSVARPDENASSDAVRKLFQ